MQSQKMKIAILLIFCLLIINLASNNVFFLKAQTSDNYVTPQIMQIYANTLITEYNNTINQYFSDMKSDFSFSSNAYTVKSFISSQYGAALWFEPSNSQTFTNENPTEPIEIAVFGGNNLLRGVFQLINSYSTMHIVGTDIGDSPLTKLVNSTFIITNSTIVRNSFQQHFTCVIMRDNNETSNWTIDVAKQDANELLYNDMHVQFSTSETVKERYAEPELTNLLQQILTKFGDTSKAYSLSQWNLDMQNIENIAKSKYNMGNPTGFINELITYFNSRASGVMPTIPPDVTPTPTPRKLIFNQVVNDPYNFWYIVCFGFTPIMNVALVLFLNNYRKKKSKSELLEIILAGFSAFFSLFIADLAYYRPWDLNATQIIIIAIIAILGISLVAKERKLIFTLFKKKRQERK